MIVKTELLWPFLGTTHVFSCVYHEDFKNIYLENICKWVLCVTLLFYLPSFSKFIQNFFLHAQLLLLCHIFCIISVDKQYLKRCAVASNKIQCKCTCTKNIGNRVKQCENLKKKLESVNTCCFSTILAKICAKQKFQILKFVYKLPKTNA